MRRIPLALVLSSLLLGTAWAEEPVHFADPKLKAAVEDKLFISDPTPTDMLGLTELVIPLTWQRINAISNLSGLEYAMNLTDPESQVPHGQRPVAPLRADPSAGRWILSDNRIQRYLARCPA